MITEHDNNKLDPETAEASVDLLQSNSQVKAKEDSRPTFSLFTKLFVFALLGLGLTTAAVAYTAPRLLEPIANAIPDGFYPADKTPPVKAFGDGC